MTRRALRIPFSARRTAGEVPRNCRAPSRRLLHMSTEPSATASTDVTAPSLEGPGAPPPAPGGVRVYLELAGTTFTLIYVALILVGMAHLWLRLFPFDLNALDYADLSDFLIAPAREPVIVLLTIAPAVLTWLYFRFTRKFVKKSRAWGDRVLGEKWSRRLGFQMEPHVERRWYLAGALLWAIAFSLQYETRRSVALKRGDADEIQLFLSGVGDGVDTVRAIELAHTSRYVIVWHPARRESEIIPNDKVIRLRVARVRGAGRDSARAARTARTRRPTVSPPRRVRLLPRAQRQLRRLVRRRGSHRRITRPDIVRQHTVRKPALRIEHNALDTPRPEVHGHLNSLAATEPRLDRQRDDGRDTIPHDGVGHRANWCASGGEGHLEHNRRRHLARL
jgi:hypothetical protein